MCQGAAVIIEHLEFRPRPDATTDALLDADRAVQTAWAPFQRGFVRRTTARSDDGRWLVETLWGDAESAAVAGAAATSDEVPAALLALADADSVRVQRWETLD